MFEMNFRPHFNEFIDIRELLDTKLTCLVWCQIFYRKSTEPSSNILCGKEQE